MAGFEIVVRPVVFPNIRPAPSRSLPPTDDPTKGFCVIKGSSGKVIDLPMSWNVSTSKSRPIEVQRTVDQVRVYQKEDNGNINRKNFVDVDIIKKIEIADPLGVKYQPSDNLTPQPKPKPEITKTNFAPVEETDNVEIIKQNYTIQNPDYKEGQ